MKIKLIKFKNVKSTNDVAIRLIKNQKFYRGLVTSEKQTKGRGTMGKKWVSKKGNLFISLFFEINQKKINFKNYSILNAFIIRKTISKFANDKINIKWPNDLLYKRKKICGILQEVISFEQKIFLIIGVGLNTNFAPYNRGFSSTSLKDIANKRIDNKKIINDIKNKYEKLLNEITRFSFLKLLKKYK